MHVRRNMTSLKISWYPPELSEYAQSRPGDDEEDAAASLSEESCNRLWETAFRTCTETDEGEKNARLAVLIKDIEKALYKRSAAVAELRKKTGNRDLRASGCSDRVPKLRPLHQCPDVGALQIAPYKVFDFPASDAEQKQLDKLCEGFLIKTEGDLRRIPLLKGEKDRWDAKVVKLKEAIEAAEAGQVRKNLEAELKDASRNFIDCRKKFYSELQFERSKGKLLETVAEVTAGTGPAYDWWVDFLANKYVLYADQVDRESEWWRFNLTDAVNGDGAESGKDLVDDDGGCCADAGKEGVNKALAKVDRDLQGDAAVHTVTWCERTKKYVERQQRAAVQRGKADEAAGVGVLGEQPKLEYGKYVLVRCITGGREHDFAVARIIENKTCEDYNDDVKVSWLHPSNKKKTSDYNGTYSEQLLTKPPKGATGDARFHTAPVGLSSIHVYGLEMPKTRTKGSGREFSAADKDTLIGADIGFQLVKTKLRYKRRADDSENLKKKKVPLPPDGCDIGDDEKSSGSGNDEKSSGNGNDENSSDGN
jgi:hypothetical protein